MNLKAIKVILIISNLNILVLKAKPVNENENSVNSEDGQMTPYPDTQKRYVDLMAVSPEVSEIISKSNLDISQIRRQQEMLKNKYGIETGKMLQEFPSQSTTRPQTPQEEEEEYRLKKIQKELETTLTKSTDYIEKAEFHYVFNAVCSVPKKVNMSTWFDTPSWSILFKPIYRQFNVKSVILRVFKTSGNNDRSSRTDVSSSSSSMSRECNTDVSQMYTVTASVYVYNKETKEARKRVIYSTMVEKSYIGWVEIDAKGTLKYWEKAKNNLGFAIDVYDQDEKILDARQHFHLQDCEGENKVPIPWSGFELIAKQNARGQPVADNIVQKLRTMWRDPRLDIMSDIPAQRDRRDSSREQERTRLQRHIRHSNHHSNEHQSLTEKSQSKRKLHKRRTLLQRDENNSTVEKT